MMEKDGTVYYLIGYIWRPNGSPEWIPANQVIIGHPIGWLLRRIKTEKEAHRLTFAMPITREQYEDSQDHLAL